MKENTHPEYKEVVFLDMSTGKKFLCRSAAQPSETTDFEGAAYPVVKVSISSDSHPFYTGDQTFVDTEGRVDKFKKKYAQGVSSGKKSAEAGAKARVKPVVKAREQGSSVVKEEKKANKEAKVPSKKEAEHSEKPAEEKKKDEKSDK